jgi:hypothetical protein
MGKRVGAHQVVLPECVGQLEATLRPARHRDRHGSIELDNGRRLQPGQQRVETRDLLPIGLVSIFGLAVERDDRCLDEVRAGSSVGKAVLDESGPGDNFGSPAATMTADCASNHKTGSAREAITAPPSCAAIGAGARNPTSAVRTKAREGGRMSS